MTRRTDTLGYLPALGERLLGYLALLDDPVEPLLRDWVVRPETVVVPGDRIQRTVHVAVRNSAAVVLISSVGRYPHVGVAAEFGHRGGLAVVILWQRERGAHFLNNARRELRVLGIGRLFAASEKTRVRTP